MLALGRAIETFNKGEFIFTKDIATVLSSVLFVEVEVKVLVPLIFALVSKEECLVLVEVEQAGGLVFCFLAGGAPMCFPIPVCE